MMQTIAAVLNADEVARVRTLIDAADWTDGNATSGTNDLQPAKPF